VETTVKKFWGFVRFVKYSEIISMPAGVARETSKREQIEIAMVII